MFVDVGSGGIGECIDLEMMQSEMVYLLVDGADMDDVGDYKLEFE